MWPPYISSALNDEASSGIVQQWEDLKSAECFSLPSEL